jgi:hypothetical protein
MTSMKAIQEALDTVNFDKNLAIQTNDKEYYTGYREVEIKLKEAMELMKKYNLI